MNAIVEIRNTMKAMTPEFKAALPPHVDTDKFARVAMTAIQSTPALLEADRRSLYGACVKLAQDGLLPDGREAALVVFNSKGGKMVQAMPMIAGVLKKIRNSGEVAKVNAQVVYENDHFLVSYGYDENVEHSPPRLGKPRGKALGAYATAVLKDGSKLLEVMDLEQIEKVRKVSRASGNGPWVDWWDEMARKTVLRRLSKRLPQSSDIEDAFDRDETMRVSRDALQTLDATPEAEINASDRLSAIESQIDASETIDPETGEIIETGDEADAPHPAEAIAAEAIAAIEAAETPDEVATIAADFGPDLMAMPEEFAKPVNKAIDKRLKALAKAA